MCFSAEASFGVGGALLVVGSYCVVRATRRGLALLPLALMPVAFGAQQVAEGQVWLGLQRGNVDQAQWAGVLFLFFALAFWPFWLPFSFLFLEDRRRARLALAALTASSVVWLWLFAPLATSPGQWLAIEVVHHSIAYEFSELPAFQFVPRNLWRGLYLTSICAPLVIARPGGGRRGLLQPFLAAVVAALFLVSYLVYWYAFTSVWCFFAAILSLALGYVFARLPAPDAQAKVDARPSPEGAERATGNA